MCDKFTHDGYSLVDVGCDTAVIDAAEPCMPCIGETGQKTLRQEGVAVSQRRRCVFEVVKVILFEVRHFVLSKTGMQTRKRMDGAQSLLCAGFLEGGDEKIATHPLALDPR